jgi:hypothetical protein
MSALVWLSFCDPDRPAGAQFLGACIVDVSSAEDPRAAACEATTRAWELECNPGGQVEASPVPEDLAPRIDKKWIGRLLSRAQVDAFDAEIMAKGLS